jgi:hypothetical protein
MAMHEKKTRHKWKQIMQYQDRFLSIHKRLNRTPKPLETRQYNTQQI